MPNQKIVCPACGHEQPESNECLKCGIIFRKYRQRSAQPREINQVQPEPESAKPSSSSQIPIKTGIIVLLSVIFIAYGITSWWTSRPIMHGPGEVAPDNPEQTKPSVSQFDFKEFRVTPLADFYVNARVLSKKKYMFGREAELCPYDLALGWGPMSDEDVLKDIKIKQSNRFYYWSVKHFPIPQKQIERHSANMHLIPEDSDVLKEIKKARVGDVVDFSGYLIRIQADDGWWWKSSTTRNDTGAGACEVIFVEEFSIE